MEDAIVGGSVSGMKPSVAALFLLCLGTTSCGGEEFSAQGSGGSTASGGSAGGGGAAGAGGGAGGSGGSTAGGGTSGGGSGGAATCPGTATGCVIDWAGQFGQPGNANGVGKQARFTSLGAITGDGNYVYVGSSDAIQRIEISSATVSTLAGQPGQPGYVNAVGTAARFSGIGGLATDGKTLWVAESMNQTLRAVDLASGTVKTLAGTQGVAGVADGVGAAAQFNAPRGLELVGGRLVLVEAGNHAVREIDPKTGAVVTLAGKNGAGSADGPGNLAQFSSPRALGAFNNEIWVGDTENHRLRKVIAGNSAAASTVSSPVGSTQGWADGVGTVAQLNRLRGVTSDGAELLVADSDNFVIRKVNPKSLNVSTIAGTAGNQNHAEGVGAAAAFNKPTDVHFDPGTGDLFITEADVVRRMYYK